MMRIRAVLAALLLATFAVGRVEAQTAIQGTVEVLDYHDSGELYHPGGPEAVKVHTKTYSYLGAASLRVIFGQWSLGPNDYIEVHGVQDDNHHRLTPTEMTKWQGSSAYFNGDSVEISLWLAPGSVGSFEIYSYLVGLGGSISNLPAGVDSQCGTTDDRVASTDQRSGRFMTASGSAGCTIWLASANSVALSAGHCFDGGSLTVAEFNVPPSLSSGAVQHSPDINDQFPVDPSTVSFTNGGVGNDWGVCKLFTNAAGQTAPARNGGFFTVTTLVPVTNDTIRVTGYGTDTGVENQTLQTHSGPLQFTNFSSATSRQLNYQVDTTGGNSGSPVIYEANGDAIGIHTHAGCTSTGGGNSGTHLSHSAFQAAFTALVAPAAPTAGFTASATTVLVGQSVTFTDASSGVPTSWAWDFDNNGSTDATTISAAWVYTTPGVYSVKLTVTNAYGSDTLLQNNLITVNAVMPATVPYSQNFNSGLPAGGEWIFYSADATGRQYVGQSGTVSPVSGGDALILDSSGSGVYATNEATLLIDLTGGGILEYWFKETLDEDDPEDGCFLSDGVTEILLQAHLGSIPNWTKYSIDLAAAASNAGLPLTSSMRIIFRQRDNFGVPTDGHLIDDVGVFIPAATPGQASRPGLAAFDINGALNINHADVSSGAGGPFFTSVSAGGNFGLGFDGGANQAIAVLYGALNLSSASYPNGVGQFDIGGPGVDVNGIPVNIGVFVDAITWAQNGFIGLPIDAMFFTGASGQLDVTFTFPSFGLTGVLATFQSAITAPAAPFVYLSNAVVVSVN
ncbi:MAG: PKD domain-containing protein [Planctomycetes bacterium]|nr:PKD domain-containing protein [Planctomycetota bacterium]